MPNAEIISIGTELLLGEIADTNTAFIAKHLNANGIDVFRTIIVGDNPKRITKQIQDSLQNADLIIATGGLGPTVDDPTRKAVADVYREEIVFHSDLWNQIEERFAKFGRTPTKNNKRQAYLPKSAVAIKNPVGTAPAFYVFKSGKLVLCLPGVPAEMRFLLTDKAIPIIKDFFDLDNRSIYSRTIHTIGIGESRIDEIIGYLEETANPSVGITAKPGQVDIRITAKSRSKEEANTLIQPIFEEIESVLGKYVYGIDDDTILSALTQKKSANHLAFFLITKNVDDEIVKEFQGSSIFDQILIEQQDNNAVKNRMDSLYNNAKNIDCVQLKITQHAKHNQFSVEITNRNKKELQNFYFGGHPALMPEWIINNTFGFIYKSISKGG